MKKGLEVVGAIFIRDGLVFAARRGVGKYAYLSHKLEFVGGKVDPGENAEEALLRELREEMALKAHIVHPYDAVLHTYPDFTIHLQTFLCEMDSDYVILEHEEALWLSIDTLDTTDWAPADAPIVEKIKREFGKE